MVPRSQIEAFNLDMPLAEIGQQISTAYHRRLLVFQGHPEEIAGIVRVRDYLRLSQTEEITRDNLLEIVREPYFVPAGSQLFSQIQHFQENQERVGLVVDEYGELMGLVTLEDILEEIIGEFTTNSPLQTGRYSKQEDGSYLVEGSTLLRELNRKLGFDFPRDGPKTLNGLILEHLQDIPQPNTSVKIGEYLLEIVQTQDRVVKVVRIFPPAKA
jgi:Mg2+/Co2+ transporter CorB